MFFQESRFSPLDKIAAHHHSNVCSAVFPGLGNMVSVSVVKRIVFSDYYSNPHGFSLSLAKCLNFVLQCYNIE